MIVRELIELLKAEDQEAEVSVTHKLGSPINYEVVGVGAEVLTFEDDDDAQVSVVRILEGRMTEL